MQHLGFLLSLLHSLKALATREPRHLQKIHVGIEIREVKVGMGMLGTPLRVIEMLDTLVVMGMAMLDIT